MRRKVEVELSWDDIELQVTGTYYPGHPGSFYKRNGDPGDPPDPPDLEIESVKIRPLGYPGPWLETVQQFWPKAAYERIQEDTLNEMESAAQEAAYHAERERDYEKDRM